MEIAFAGGALAEITGDDARGVGVWGKEGAELESVGCPCGLGDLGG